MVSTTARMESTSPSDKEEASKRHSHRDDLKLNSTWTNGSKSVTPNVITLNYASSLRPHNYIGLTNTISNLRYLDDCERVQKTAHRHMLSECHLR